MRKPLLLGLAALAALTIACSTGDTSSSVTGGDAQDVATAESGAKTTAKAKLGQTVTLTNDSLGDKTVVDVTVANAKQYAKEPGDFGSEPENGTFLVLDVTAVCKGGSYHVNPFNFKFVAKDGTVTEGAFVSFKPDLRATDLSKGQKAAGKIAFDVPKAAIKGGKIQIDGVGFDFDKPAAFWTL